MRCPSCRSRNALGEYRGGWSVERKSGGTNQSARELVGRRTYAPIGDPIPSIAENIHRRGNLIMKKLTLIVATGLLIGGTAFAAPLTDQGTSTSTSTGTQADQVGKANTNAKAKSKMGTTGSGMNNAPSPAKDTMQKNKSPASQGSGIKQEK
jgi:hypothetical protein